MHHTPLCSPLTTPLPPLRRAGDGQPLRMIHAVCHRLRTPWPVVTFRSILDTPTGLPCGPLVAGRSVSARCLVETLSTYPFSYCLC